MTFIKQINKQMMTDAGKDVKTEEPVFTAGGIVN